MLGLIWIQSVWHLDGNSERIFSKKKMILKKISRQKGMKKFPGGNELMHYTCEMHSV